MGRGEVIGAVHCGERGGYRGCTLWGEEVIGGVHCGERGGYRRCTLWGEGRL